MVVQGAATRSMSVQSMGVIGSTVSNQPASNVPLPISVAPPLRVALLVAVSAPTPLSSAVP